MYGEKEFERTAWDQPLPPGHKSHLQASRTRSSRSHTVESVPVSKVSQMLRQLKKHSADLVVDMYSYTTDVSYTQHGDIDACR